MPLKSSLLRRISALITATEFLVPNVGTGSRAVVVKWLKADLSALEQLRKQIQQEEDGSAKNDACEAALAAIIKAKYSALDRLDKKKPRKAAPSTRRKVTTP